MSAFESQFPDRLLPGIDNEMFTQVANLTQRITDLEDLLGWKKSLLKFTDGNIDDLDVMLKSLQETINEIRARKQPYLDEKSKIRQDMSSDENNLQAAKRELFRLQAELEAQRKLREGKEKIRQETADAPWRTGVNGKKALPHQLEGAERLTFAGRAILGDKMGLGKTLQAIMTIDMLRVQGKAKKVLIICPKPILDGFENEFRRWSPGKIVFVLNQTLKGLKSEILDLVAMMDDCIIITNYEVWRKDRIILDRLKRCQFDTVILDEAHNLQNPESLTAKTVKELVHAENQCMHCGSLTFGTACPVCGQKPTELCGNRSVKNIFPMTGTPILNKPQDLFTMLNLLDDIGFPSKTRFLQDFCERKCAGCHRSYSCECEDKPKWVYVFTSGGEAALLRRLGMRFTSRTRESAGVQMPPQEVKHWKFDFDPEKYPKQYEFCEALRKDALIKFTGDRELTQYETLAWYTRMRQSATWPDGIHIKTYKMDVYGEFVLDDQGKRIVLNEYRPQVGESIIMDEGERIIREAVESGNRIVVFSHFKEALKEMERRLKLNDISVVRYDGDLSDQARKEAQHDFDLTITRPENAKFSVMLAQYKTAKVGLNLHGANEILCLDREWNPGSEAQALDRIRRIGSEFESTVHLLSVPGSPTDLIDSILAQKAAMLEGFENEVQEFNLQEAIRKFLEGK